MDMVLQGREVGTMEEMYVGVSDLIDRTVKGFVRRYGGHFDDLRADANMFFVQGYMQYARGGGSDNFNTNTRRWVWMCLFDDYRTRRGWRRESNPAMIRGDLIFDLKDHIEFNLTMFLLHLGEDAAIAVGLIFETPGELLAIAEGRGGEPRNYRSAVREHLTGLGWSCKQIKEAFTEVREALQ